MIGNFLSNAIKFTERGSVTAVLEQGRHDPNDGALGRDDELAHAGAEPVLRGLHDDLERHTCGECLEERHVGARARVGQRQAAIGAAREAAVNGHAIRAAQFD